MHRSTRVLEALLLAGALLLVPVAATAAQSDDEVVATVGGKAITLAELEEFLAAQLDQIERERHKILEQGLEPLIQLRLLEAEAERRGDTTAQELLQSEVESRTQPVTDEQVEAWYQQNASRLQNRPKDQLLPQIKAFLGQQAGAVARQAFVDELREKQEVKVLFEPLRAELELTDATLKGPADAPITLVEFSDFQCPACKSFNPILSQVLDEYGDKIQVAFRQFPLRSIHPQAQPAAEAALCAREQGKFWQIHDAMFADQRSLNPPDLKQLARTLELDGEAFDACFDEGRHRPLIEEDLARGQQLGVSGTPSVFINGREVAPGKVPSYEQMKDIIEDELRRAES